jgi:hypothetical protein
MSFSFRRGACQDRLDRARICSFGETFGPGSSSRQQATCTHRALEATRRTVTVAADFVAMYDGTNTCDGFD